MRPLFAALGVALLLYSTALVPPRADGLADAQSPVVEFVESAGAAAFLPGELLVRWREPDPAGLVALTAASEARQISDGVWKLDVVPGTELDALRRLESDSHTIWAQPNYVRHLLESATDPRFGEQWALQKMHVPDAWDTTLGDARVVVAVIDTGVDLLHPDLKDRLVEGYNFLDPAASPQDDAGHGTHAAGTIAATINNGVGVAGVAPGVSIMPLKAISRRGTGNDAVVATAIHYAANHGAWVINMSFGGSIRSPAIEEALAYAGALGVVLVASAGNDGRAAPVYPAATKPSIAVAATTIEDGRPGFTNFGTWVSVSAPGQQILSTFWDRTNGSGYRILSGTSMAAPHVSGLVALLFSVNPALTPAEISSIIETTADPLGGTGLGAGRVNAVRAVAAAGGNQPEGLPGATSRPGPGSALPAPGSPTSTTNAATLTVPSAPPPASPSPTPPRTATRRAPLSTPVR